MGSWSGRESRVWRRGSATAPATCNGCSGPSSVPGLRLADLRDLGSAVERCRRLLDLDADPDAIAAVLGADPDLGPLVLARPGLRVPGHVDGFEVAVRAIIGQQISLAGARTLAARIVEDFGTKLSVDDDELTTSSRPRVRSQPPVMSGLRCQRREHVHL